MTNEQIRRQKISQTLKRKYLTGENVYKPPMLGKSHSPKTLEKMRLSAKNRIAKGIAIPYPGVGINHPNWRGGRALYESTHNWVISKLGRPNKCQQCGSTEKKRYEWANLSGEYKRIIDDWIRLCVSCHRKMDYLSPKRPMQTFPNNKKRVGETIC